MRVSGVTVTPIALPIEAPRRHSDGITFMTTRTILQVETDEGLIGLGEVGSRVPQDRIRGLAKRLIGEDPFALQRLSLQFAHGKFYFQDIATLFAGVEMACLDLQGKYLGRPVSDLLGGRVRDQIPLIAYVFPLLGTSLRPAVVTADELVTYTSDLIDRFGFGTIKLKGGADSPEDDIHATQALREAFPKAALRLDPNAAWSVETSITVAHAVRACNLEWLEDPTLDITGMAEVTRRGGIPTATNMCLTHAGEFARAAAIRAVDVVLCDLGYAGGLRAAQELAAMCKAFSMGVGVHSQGESGVGMAAMLHLASTLPTLVHAMDAHYHHLQDDIIAGGRLEVVDGEMHVPSGVGLGIEIDQDRLQRYSDLYQQTARQRGSQPDPSRPDWFPTYPAW